jgi:nitroreductase
MNVLEAIAKRRAVRAYKPDAVPEEAIHALLRRGHADLDLRRTGRPTRRRRLLVAAQNLMLAAAALGLGTCPIGFAIPALNRPEVKAELGLPRDVSVVAPIVVGVPRDEAARPTSRKAPEIVSWVRAPASEPDPCVTDLRCWPE